MRFQFGCCVEQTCLKWKDPSLGEFYTNECGEERPLYEILSLLATRNTARNYYYLTFPLYVGIHILEVPE